MARLPFAAALILFLAIGCGTEKKSGPPVVPGTGNIEGQIVWDDGAGNQPAIISYEGTTQERRSRLTNGEGLFLFHDAEAGDGRLWITPPPGFDVAPGQENPVTVLVPEGGLAHVDVRLAAVTDTIGPDSSSVGFIDARAETELLPARGVYVRATGSSPDDVYAGTTADQGHAVIATPEGSYTISAITPSWYKLSGIEPASVTVTKGGTTPVLIRVQQVGSLPPGGLEIFVANPDSVPEPNPVPPGVEVTVTRLDVTGFVASDTTDERGMAHFDVEAGLYQVAIVVPAGWVPWPDYPNPVDVAVESATSSWARFYLSMVITATR